MAAQTPITVLCGFLGAGKTTLLKHLLLHESARGQRVAAIANDVAALNIDGSLISHAVSGRGAKPSVVEAGAPDTKPGSAEGVLVLTLEGGSICSALQDDLATQLLETVAGAAAQPFDHVFVECSGVTHPAAIIALFADHPDLRRCARLHATLTVVDCFNLRRVLLPSGAGSVTVEQAWKSVRAEWDDVVTNLYIEQIECASVLVLNKADTVSDTEYESCRACVEAFNRRTQPIRASFGQIDTLELVKPAEIDGQLSEPSQALSSRRWLLALSEGREQGPEAVFRTFVYERRRPFHPLKLRWFVAHKYHTLNVLRSKGFCWLASRHEFQGEWSGAGAMLAIDSMCRWYSSQSEQEWVRAGLSACARKTCREKLRGEYGDRRQELVFIGLSAMDEAEVTAALDACLISQEQLAAGAASWAAMEDPWAEWSVRAVESTMMAQTRDAVAEREKYKLDLWLEKETVQIDSGAGAGSVEDIRANFERLKAVGEAKAEQGELAQALAAWDEALLLKGVEGAVEARDIAIINDYEAQLLMEAEDYFGAIHTCDRALEVCSDLLVAAHTKARAQLELGELAMAEQELRALQERIGTQAPGDGVVDAEELAEDLARCLSLQAEARKLEEETGGQVLRGELVLPGATWNKSCYGSRMGKPGDMNCDTRNRLYLNLLMARALDVDSAATAEDYVSDRLSNVYGLLPVRVGCPAARPMSRELQFCAAVEPLKKLLASQKSVKSSSLRFPTSVCAPGESPEQAASRAFTAHFGDSLGSVDDLWKPSFLPPVMHYHQLPSGATEVQTYFIVVSDPAVTGGSVADGAGSLVGLAERILLGDAARPVHATELIQLRERLRWSPEQAMWGLLRHVADGTVQRDLPPGDDGWYEPQGIIRVAETLLQSQQMQQLLTELIGLPKDSEGATVVWGHALLSAVEFLCASWNIASSLAPLLRSILSSNLVPVPTFFKWYMLDPRQLFPGLGDCSTEAARSEVLLSVHSARAATPIKTLMDELRLTHVDAAAKHDAAHIDTSNSPMCHWTQSREGVLMGATAIIADKAAESLLQAAGAGLMNQASADWSRLEPVSRKTIKRPAAAITAPSEDAVDAGQEGLRGLKRKRPSLPFPTGGATRVDLEIDLLIVGAGASGIGCAVQAKLFGIEPSRTLIVERGDRVGASFDRWPAEMRFITPSFNQQAFGFMDLNSVAYDTSPAQLLHEQHPTGAQYAEYLREVARIHALQVAFQTDVAAIRPLGQQHGGVGQGVGSGLDSSPFGASGFEVSLRQPDDAPHKLPSLLRVKHVIWAAGEFQYPKCDGFPGSELCVHNSTIQSWSREVQQTAAKERVVIGGYESGIDATVNLAAQGVRVTVAASVPFWSQRTLDPSTELAPYSAGRLKAALKSQCPPELIGHCRVVRVDPGPGGAGFVVTAEKRTPATMPDAETTALVRQTSSTKTEASHGHGHGHGPAKAGPDSHTHGHAHGADGSCPDEPSSASCEHGHGHGHGHGSDAAESAEGPGKIAIVNGSVETIRFETALPPILATGFKSSVGTVVSSLFQWTQEGACGGEEGDPKLTKHDESTVAPGLFLVGPQVRQADEILCFVYKYRQRFAIVVNEISQRLGLDTTDAVASARRQHMFLDDPTCCKATCGAHSC